MQFLSKPSHYYAVGETLVNNKRYQLVIFDWEGTLSDTLGQVLDCVATQAKKLNFEPFDEKLARKSIDLGLVNAIKRVFSHLDSQEQYELIDAVQEELTQRHGETYLMPGALDLIQKLQKANIELAIATNKGHQSLHLALVHSGLDSYFRTTRSASQTAPKPDPEMLEQILTELAIEPQAALMVGDSVIDMEMAKRVHIDAIGVNFYDQDASALNTAGAKAVFNQFKALADYLHLA